ncbi:MAG: type II secretion system F family protein [Gammaproteobacteria bacterium]|nr:type II secretion system F family protein [Gammaproteobacteria bacterium]
MADMNNTPGSGKSSRPARRSVSSAQNIYDRVQEISFDSVKGQASRFVTGVKHFQFGAKAQLAFLEDLYVLVADGIPPNRAIDMVSEVTTGISKDVAVSIAKKISEGQPLADGMREWFAPNVIEIIRVGEEGGALAQTMKSAINTLGQSSSSVGVLIGAVAYPLLVIIMACAIILYLNGSVFVQFKAIKPVAQWPEAGRTLLSVAGLIQSWWWAVLVGIFASVIIIRKIMTSYTGELRPYLDKVFPFTLYRQFAAARFMETLGLLVSNGVVFKNALKVMQHQANPYLGSHLMMMEHLLGMGRGNIADVLSSGLISEKDILRLRVMAEVKGFEHGLVRMGVHGSEQTAKTLKAISKLFGGVLLLVGAILIIVIVRGIFLTGMSMGA